MNGDKLPHFFSQEVEKQVVGACLADQSNLAYFSGLGVNETWFASNQMKCLWKAVEELDSNGEDVDITTVAIHLSSIGKLEVVPPNVIAETSSEYYPSTSTEFIFNRFAEQRRLRRLFNVSTKLNMMMYQRPCESAAVLSFLRRECEQTEQCSNNEPASLSEVYQNMLSSFLDIGTTVKLSLGLPRLDSFIGPLYPSDTTLIAGESSIGKTSFVMGVLRHINRVLRYPVLLFSLEMDDLITAIRCLSSDSHIRLTDIREGKVNFDNLLKQVEKHASNDFFIECNTWTLDHIEAKTRYMVRKYGIRAVGVDYLQLVDANLGRSANREQEVNAIGRAMKKMAKDNGIHVFALAQLDDAWGGRGQSKKPTGKNLRESKALKHHTDNLMILRRTDKKDCIECYCDKLRNNQIGSISIGFIGSQTRFVDSVKEVPQDRR